MLFSEMPSRILGTYHLFGRVKYCIIFGNFVLYFVLHRSLKCNTKYKILELLQKNKTPANGVFMGKIKESRNLDNYGISGDREI